MEFIFETAYDQKTLKTMARALRKTVRKKHSKRSHVFGWIVVVLALLLALPLGDKVFVFNLKTVITYLTALAICVVLLFEDGINGYIAGKRMLKGTEQAKTTFRENGYFSETEMGNTEWKYENIEILAETEEYFVFIFSFSHAQVFDKRHLAGGTTEQFKSFIQDKTNKEMVWIGRK